MYENDYMYAVERDDNALAHYGIKGMKWGVRKAILSGNGRRLDRQYRKAARKLAKLEKRANSGAKYARRAAALGAGAAAAGGLAALGTGGVSNAMRVGAGGLGRASTKLGAATTRLGKAMTARGIRGGGRLQAIGQGAQSFGLKGATGLARGGYAVDKWGRSTSIASAAANRAQGASNRLIDTLARNTNGNRAAAYAVNDLHKANNRAIKQLGGVSNNTIARIGAGAIGAGLAGAAGYNAYRAATTKRAARKAAEWRREMNDSFRGTQYASGGNRQGKKRRR